VKDLRQRTLSSILFVCLILGPLLLTARVAYAVYSILGAFTLNELLNISKKTGNHPQKGLSLVFYVIGVLGAYQWVFEQGDYNKVFGLLAFGVMLIAIIVEVFRTNQRPLEAIATSLFAPTFVGISFLGLAYFYAWRSDLPSFWLTASVFTLIWVNDAGAYLFGRKIGRRKLFERLSPNKTIEGSLAGLCCALAAAVGLAQIEGMPSLAIMLGFASVIVVSGSLGDLFESRMKRDAGIKDSGVFLPGHGGFFDRFDAMMLAIPIAILFFETFYPKP
jgi:phosphatidate cytidylyltransferase